MRLMFRCAIACLMTRFWASTFSKARVRSNESSSRFLPRPPGSSAKSAESGPASSAAALGGAGSAAWAALGKGASQRWTISR